MRNFRGILIALSGLAVVVAPGGATYAKNGQSKWPIVTGEVIAVAPEQNTFEVRDVDGQTGRFKVTPATEFEVERDRPVKFNWAGSFSDVKTGSWIRVKYFGSTETKVAHDIDIFSGPTR